MTDYMGRYSASIQDRSPAHLAANGLDRMIFRLPPQGSRAAEPERLSASHSRAKRPSWISSRIRFISALVSAVTIRGPRV